MLKLVYGDYAVTMKKVYNWFEGFRTGCEWVEDEERLGRLSTSKTQERVSEMIRSYRRLTIRNLFQDWDKWQAVTKTEINLRVP